MVGFALALFLVLEIAVGVGMLSETRKQYRRARWRGVLHAVGGTICLLGAASAVAFLVLVQNLE